MANEIQTSKPTEVVYTCGGRPLAPVEPLWRMAEGLAGSTVVPPEFQGKPANVFLALVLGWEYDLPPVTALASTMVVNNRAKFFGSLPLALVRRSGLFDEQQYREWFEGANDEYAAHCQVARINCPPIIRKFSIRDAKRAGLWDKDNWRKYPQRMLAARARGYALDDAFSDVLRGVAIPADSREDAVAFAQEVAAPAPAPSLPPPLAMPQAERLKAKAAAIAAPLPATEETLAEDAANHTSPAEGMDAVEAGGEP